MTVNSGVKNTAGTAYNYAKTGDWEADTHTSPFALSHANDPKFFYSPSLVPAAAVPSDGPLNFFHRSFHAAAFFRHFTHSHKLLCAGTVSKNPSERLTARIRCLCVCVYHVIVDYVFPPNDQLHSHSLIYFPTVKIVCVKDNQLIIAPLTTTIAELQW